MVVATVMYRDGIDVEYYLNKHIPMSEEVMVPLGLKRAEVRQFEADPEGGAPKYVLMTTLYFETVESFQACMQNPAMAPLMEDVKNFYHGQPEVLVGGELVTKEYGK